MSTIARAARANPARPANRLDEDTLPPMRADALLSSLASATSTMMSAGLRAIDGAVVSALAGARGVAPGSDRPADIAGASGVRPRPRAAFAEQSNASSPQEAAGRAQVGATTDAPKGTEAERYDAYRALIERNGGVVRTEKGRRNLLGLRTETDADTRGGRGAYDDKMVMLWRDKDGNKRVREYVGNTEPSAKYRGRYGEDVDRDGRKDQGRLPAGTYDYGVSSSRTLGRVLRPVADYRVERDTNHDGLFNDGVTSRGGNSMLFHRGGSGSTGSAGCQTLPPAEFKRFWRDLTAAGNPGRVAYTIVDVDR